MHVPEYTPPELDSDLDPMALPFSFDLDGGARTTGILYAAAAAAAPPMLALAHGAGADQRHRFMVAVAEGLSARGFDVVTFNFLYMEQRRRTPDRTDALESCWRRAIDAVEMRARGPLFLGGKSMGGRIASQVAAQPRDRPPADDERRRTRVAGLVFLGYPLHPPGKPSQLRDKHLPAVPAPMLFVQGARDAFGTPDELAPVVARCASATVHVVADADHSFAVPKRSGRSESHVVGEILEAVSSWIRSRTR